MVIAKHGNIPELATAAYCAAAVSFFYSIGQTEFVLTRLYITLNHKARQKRKQFEFAKKSLARLKRLHLTMTNCIFLYSNAILRYLKNGLDLYLHRVI